MNSLPLRYVFCYIFLLLSIILGGAYLSNKIDANRLDLNNRLSRLERLEEFRMMRALKDLLQTQNNDILPKPPEDRDT